MFIAYCGSRGSCTKLKVMSLQHRFGKITNLKMKIIWRCFKEMRLPDLCRPRLLAWLNLNPTDGGQLALWVMQEEECTF